MATTATYDPGVPARASFQALTNWVGVHVRPIFAVWTTVLALLAVTWGGVSYHLQLEKQAAVESARRQLSNYARLLEEHTIRLVRVLDQTTMFIKTEHERTGGAISLRDFSSKGVFLDRFFNQISITGPDGYVINLDRNIPPSNISDREHFRVHKDNDQTGLFISKPVLGRSSGKWSIQFTRRINQADGSFGGIVVASLDPKYFTNFYRSLDIGVNGAATLLGMDGVVRARQSGNNEEIGQDVSKAQVFQQIKSSKFGIYESRSAVDGVKRMYAYRKLDAYPLVVLVGLGEDYLYDGYDEHRQFILVLGVLVSLLILGIGLLLLSVIRHQQQVQAALQASAREAEAASLMKSEFIARMSHELRTPLNGILGLSEYLKSSLDSDENQELASDIYKSGSHLLALVNTTLDLAKIEAGRMELVCKDEDIASLVDGAVAMQRAFADSKGLSLSREIAPGMPATISCDATKLTQILNNLLHNAIKFTNAGSVSLMVTSDAAQVHFAVTDTGSGISPDEQAHLFERFRQLGGKFEKRVHAGTGLGLALARDFAQLMGGRSRSTPVWVRAAHLRCRSRCKAVFPVRDRSL